MHSAYCKLVYLITLFIIYLNINLLLKVVKLNVLPKSNFILVQNFIIEFPPFSS